MLKINKIKKKNSNKIFKKIDNCPVELFVEPSKEIMKEGEASEFNITINNLSKDGGQPMTMAIIGIPGGLEVRLEKLDELVKSKTIDFYEIRGRELCVYLVEMDLHQSVHFSFDVIAKIPGTYYGPASRTYLYYTNEEKRWVAPTKVEIEPHN